MDESTDLVLEDEFVVRVQEELYQQLDNSDFGANEIADIVGMSRTQFYRKIKALTGESPANYVRHLRLLEARKMLSDPKIRVSEVAYSVGFSNPTYFTQSYTKAFGKAPSEDRS